MAGAIEVLIKSKNNNGKNIFHIASGETLTILELAYKVKAVFSQRYKKDIKIILPDNSISEYPDPDSSKDIDRYVISANRLKIFGFKQELDLELGINDIFNYLNKEVV